MTADVVERIFKEFKFRTLSKTSSKNQIYKSIINTAFKANIICTKISKDENDKSVNVSYSINGDLQPYLESLYDICINYAKKQMKIPPMIIGDDQIECPE